jgi:predicted AAA+ superfamily ATPase
LSIKEQIGLDTIIMEDFNTPLLSIDRTFRQKINKDILERNNIMDKMALTDICRVVLPTAANYTFFLAATELSVEEITSWTINQTSTNSKKFKITLCILTDYKEIKLEITSKKNYKQHSKPW